MWCLEELCLGPQRLLRRGDCLLRGRVRRSTAARPAAFSNVLTPDRIPEFCIPPRLAPSPGLAALRNSWGRERDTDEGAARTDWDPRSQAALSLPHLPRMRTAYGFCALLESPHTRRKESLLLGGSGTAALLPRPRAHAHGAGGDAPRAPPSLVPAAGPLPLSDTLVPRPPGRCLLGAPDGLLGRALRARKRDGLARARCVSGAHEAPPTWNPAAAPPPPPRPDRRQAEGTVTLERAGVALRLAAEYCPGSGHLRVRLLRADGPAGGTAEPRAVSCRVSFVLRPPGPTRRRRGAVVRRSRNPAVGQDFCFDGLTEDEVRRLAVRVKAGPRGRGLERGRLRGRGELPLGPLLLL